MNSRGEEFRHSQLVSAIQAVIEDRFLRIESLPQAAGSALPNHLWVARFKGSREAELADRVADGEISFYVDEPHFAFEWYAVETDGNAQWRWTGPATRSSFYLPARIESAFKISIQVMSFSDPDAVNRASLIVNDCALTTSRTRLEDGSWLLSATLDPKDYEYTPIEMVTIACESLFRPFDRGAKDRRWLGLPVGRIVMSPIKARKGRGSRPPTKSGKLQL
jgi:hypothetical protein